MVPWQRGNGITLQQIDPRRGLVLSAASNRSATRAIYRKQKPLNSAMDPYAKPKERRIGAQRPKNHAFVRGRRNPNTERPGGREASGRSRAARHQKISASTFKAATAGRDERAGLKSVYVSSTSWVSTSRFQVVD